MALGDEYKVLKTFLIWAQTDIDFVIQKFLRKYVDRYIIPPNIYEAAVTAWRELKPRFDEAMPKIAEIPINDLAKAGLWGPQLNFKIMIYDYVRRKLTETPRPAIVRRLFRIFKGIKDSLCPLIGCILEPVDEFLDAIDSALP